MRIASAVISPRLIALLSLAAIGLAALGPSGPAQAQSACPVEESQVQQVTPLINGIPQQGTVRPTMGDFASLDLTQYTFQVPSSPELAAGEARLVIDLTNLTNPDNDIDLLVRIGEPVDVFLDDSGDCRVHVDYTSRGDFGEEQVTIDGGSDPPLQETIYYVAVLNFEFDRPAPQEYELVANLTPPPPPPCPGCRPLEPNRPQSGEIAAGPLVDLEGQYILSLPRAADFLGLLLQGEGNAELNLYLRTGQPVERNGDQLISDFALIAPGASQSLVISGAGLRPGLTYFLAVGNRSSEPAKFALTAVLAPQVQEISDGGLGISLSGDTGLPQLGGDLTKMLEGKTRSAGGRLGLRQYRLVVPKGAKSLQLQLSSTDAQIPLRLHLALEQPVGLDQGQVLSDMVTGGSTTPQTLSLTGKLLQPGVYYLAVEGLSAQAAGYKLQIALDDGQPPRPALPNGLLQGGK